VKSILLLIASITTLAAEPYDTVQTLADRLDTNQATIRSVCVPPRDTALALLELRAESCRHLFESRRALLIDLQGVLISLALKPPTNELLEPLRATIPDLTKQLAEAYAVMPKRKKIATRSHVIEVFRVQALATALRFTRAEVAEGDVEERKERETERPKMRALLVALRKQEALCETWIRRLAFAEQVYYMAASHPAPRLYARQ
jgi:hypothetical protein